MRQPVVHFLGAEELRDKFIAMEVSARINVLEQSVPAAAQIPMDKMIARAPVGDGDGYWGQPAHRKDHHVKDDLSLVTLEKNENRMIMAVQIHADSFYWRFVELGTKHAPAHPFLRQSATSSRSQVAGEIRDGMRDSLLGFTG